MIEKIYEISCDNCSHAISHTFYKPTIKDLSSTYKCNFLGADNKQ